MKYAIISDIHGNIHALKAVLSDALSHGADYFLLLGDYSSSFPWGNEVAETLRNLKNITAIRGNGEGYFINFQKQNTIDWGCEQLKPVHWAYRSLSKENLDFFAALPETAEIAEGNDKIYLSHTLNNIFYNRSPKLDLFHSYYFRKTMEANPFPRDQYLTRAREALLSRPDVLSDILKLPKGIYVFGHNHLQFHMEYEGRLFINPGSCGEPLDYNTSPAYTLLYRENNIWTVEEKRAEYDVNAVIEGLSTSGYSSYAPEWSNVMKLELLTGKDYFMEFVLHITETGKQLGRSEHPVSNDTFEAAMKTWEINTE
jgi:predicted phosphodiesterase